MKPLRELDKVHPYSELFEILDNEKPGTSKVLKILINKSTKVLELFEQEARVLSSLNHNGLPQAEEEFTFILGNGQELRCLIMEKIAGENLEHWLDKNKRIDKESQVLEWLEQLLEILDYVHKIGIFHRDIKPSNIMLNPNGRLVLIDFGTARRVTQTVVEGRDVTVVYSIGYTAPEQIEGRAVVQSDFFALGSTFVHLLTGTAPHKLTKDTQTGQLVWRDKASHISEIVADLIDSMIAPLPEHRPQTTTVILQRIQDIKKGTATRTNELTKKPITKVRFGTSRGLLSILLVGLIGTAVYPLLPCALLGNLKPCPSLYDDKLSFGEKILIPGSDIPEKEKGVNAFRDGRYSEAVVWLEKARNTQKSDPETLIYLNNARLQAQNAHFYAIAVAVPLDTGSDGLNSGLEILRGVAHAQEELNQKRTGKRIQVLIADDANNSSQAKRIAKAIVNKEKILAVIGHYTSDLTVTTAEIYQPNQLVFISPTSTSEYLSIQGKVYNSNYFFRTVPSDRDTAQALVSYLKQEANQQTVAVFYNSHSQYSNSLQNQFRNILSKNGGQIVDELDLSTPIINSGNAIDKAKKKGAKVIALFPNSQSLILNKTRKLMNANQCRYLMVGGDTLYTADILDEVGKEATNCLVIAVPWHSRHSPDSQFPQVAEKLWGGTVSWRTALAYDATRVLFTALDKTSQPSRTLLQQTLSHPNFQAIGATGEIRFQPNGDRKDAHIQFVRVQLSKQGYPVYLPLPTKH